MIINKAMKFYLNIHLCSHSMGTSRTAPNKLKSMCLSFHWSRSDILMFIHFENPLFEYVERTASQTYSFAMSTTYQLQLDIKRKQKYLLGIAGLKRSIKTLLNT